MTELHQFVSQDVAAFAAAAFGESQRVQLFTPMQDSEVSDFVVCWVSTGLEQTAPDLKTDRTSLSLDPQWASYEIARELSPYLQQPLAWGEIEADLVRAELLASGGDAYRAEAAIASNRILERLHDLESAAFQADPSPDELQHRIQLDSLQDYRTESEFVNAVNSIPDSDLSRRNVELQLARLIAAQ